jgi:hypothetical protein
MMILLLSLGCFACWGCPIFTLIIENQTECELTLYINDIELGDVNPGEEFYFDNYVVGYVTKLSAKNKEGETIISRSMSYSQTEKIGKRTVKVVIPPLGK